MLVVNLDAVVQYVINQQHYSHPRMEYPLGTLGGGTCPPHFQNANFVLAFASQIHFYLLFLVHLNNSL